MPPRHRPCSRATHATLRSPRRAVSQHELEAAATGGLGRRDNPRGGNGHGPSRSRRVIDPRPTVPALGSGPRNRRGHAAGQRHSVRERSRRRHQLRMEDPGRTGPNVRPTHRQRESRAGDSPPHAAGASLAASGRRRRVTRVRERVGRLICRGANRFGADHGRHSASYARPAQQAGKLRRLTGIVAMSIPQTAYG
jgi:hypothetical protein